jgi:hypothetical protein
MFYYQHHVGDYRRDTGHLTLLEHGIYRQLIDLYYVTEKPLDKAIAMRFICVRTADECDAYDRVLADFFRKVDGKYVHKRCDYEIQRFKGKSEKAIKSAKVRWNKNNDLQDANALQTDSEGNANLLTYKPKISTAPENQPKKEKPKKAPAEDFPIPVRFEEFWIIWPSSNRKIGKIACRDKWASKNLDVLADKIISHVKVLKASKQWLEGFDPAPMTYINQSRWEDADSSISADPWTKAGRKLL